MTNDTKAPERIWLTGFHKDQYGARLGRGSVSDLDHSPNPDYPEYIRHDLHLSLVAAAYEDMAKRHEVEAKFHADIGNTDRYLIYKQICKYSRTLTPDDAQAALEARDKQIREKAMREVLTIAGQAVKDAHTDEAQTYCNAVYDAIRALIEKEQTDE